MASAIGKWILAIDGGELPSRDLIGGKAWSIARMRELELNVPPAIVVTTKACATYLESGELPAGLLEELELGIAWLEEQSDRTFGAGPSPLLVSVRSGAAISMPGMMDTVLNLGINASTEAAFAAETGDPKFAHDTQRRFLELYASIVLKTSVKELNPNDAARDWRGAIASASGQAIPENAKEQLRAAVIAVFESSNSRRAKRYRKHHNLPDNLGTAVTIQAMVFGNLDDDSGTGVLFSRNPLTGDRAPYGEYLHRAQGEDVVSGKFTPEPLNALQASAPNVYSELLGAAETLERDAKDVQDIEFTVQRGELFLLQSRAAKRAPQAAVRFAVDFVADELIDQSIALTRVTSDQIRTLLQPRLTDDATANAECLASGEPACQGVGVGLVVTNADEAERRVTSGEVVVLARPNTSPEDVHGMIVSCAVVTDEGGATSHAAVVSRELGVACVVGCGAGSAAGLEGREVTVDGFSGKIYAGRLAVETPDESADPYLAQLIEWAQARAPIQVVTRGAQLPKEALDLDTLEGGEYASRLRSLIGQAKTVMGGALESDAGVNTALDAGVECIVSKYRLPTLLCALSHQTQAPKV